MVLLIWSQVALLHLYRCWNHRFDFYVFRIQGVSILLPVWSGHFPLAVQWWGSKIVVSVVTSAERHRHEFADTCTWTPLDYQAQHSKTLPASDQDSGFRWVKHAAEGKRNCPEMDSKVPSYKSTWKLSKGHWSAPAVCLKYPSTFCV